MNTRIRWSKIIVWKIKKIICFRKIKKRQGVEINVYVVIIRKSEKKADNKINEVSAQNTIVYLRKNKENRQKDTSIINEGVSRKYDFLMEYF